MCIWLVYCDNEKPSQKVIDVIIAKTVFNKSWDLNLFLTLWSLLFLPYSRYDLGTPIFLGLVGCFLIFLGAAFYTVTVYRVIIPERYWKSPTFTVSLLLLKLNDDRHLHFGLHSTAVYAYGGGTYMDPRSKGRTLYTGYYRPSRLYGSYTGSGRSGSSRISKISQTTPTKNSDRDAFVWGLLQGGWGKYAVCIWHYNPASALNAVTFTLLHGWNLG